MKRTFFSYLSLVVFSLLTAGVNAQSFPAPLTTIEGKAISIQELKSKIVVLNFWFLTCGPCQKELPKLRELSEKYKDDPGVLFIAISSMDDKDQLAFFKKYKDFGYQLIAENKTWVTTYGIQLFPTNIVFSKGKKIFERSGLTPDIMSVMDREISLTKKFMAKQDH